MSDFRGASGIWLTCRRMGLVSYNSSSSIFLKNSLDLITFMNADFQIFFLVVCGCIDHLCDILIDGR